MPKTVLSLLPLLVLAAGLSTSACATSRGDAASAPTPSHSPYPEIWFAPVNDPHPPAWEILPQAAGPGEVILSKRNELGILSNFAPTPFKFRGRKYGSLEGFWQMMHFPEPTVDGKPDPRRKLSRAEWKYERDAVAAMTAFDAKAAGDHGEKLEAKLGIDWVSFEGRSLPYRSLKRGEHYRLIRAAMIEKLKQNPEVRRILLATGDLVLRPDHHGEANAPDEWLYYQLWMELRAKLFAGLPLE